MATGKGNSNNLLNTVIEAHGGLERFNCTKSVELKVNRSGLLWAVKGYPGHKLVNITVKTNHPRVEFRHLVSQNDETKLVWTPDRVTKEAYDGSIIDSRDAPRTTFEGHSMTTPWDEFHLTYFSGYAIWNYIHAPFYFTWPGFETREIENELEDPKTRDWRVLEVTYPDDGTGHTHCKVQKFYFDHKFVLRRLDYVAEVVGSGPTAHMCYDHQKIGGLLFPMLRRAVRNPDGIRDGGPSAVLLDFHDVVVRDEVVSGKTNL